MLRMLDYLESIKQSNYSILAIMIHGIGRIKFLKAES